MNTTQENRLQGVALPVMLCIALMTVLTACERAERSDSAGGQAADQSTGDEQPLVQVTEFDGFTLRVNVSRTQFLPDAMARQYGIEARPDLVLLNLVVLEKRPDGQPQAVSAELRAHYESRVGQVEVIDMRAIEENGYLSYIGTLDASAQRIFHLVIEAQPEGTDHPLRMNFEVQLDTLDTE